MAASTGDKITDARNAARPASTTVSAPRSAAGSTLSCASLTGWPTASKVHFVTYKIDSSSNPIAGTQLDCSAIVSGSDLTSFTVLDGTDTGHAIGDVVEMLPTASWGQDLADALTSQHSRTGAHTAVTATSITNSGALTNTGLITANGGITATTSFTAPGLVTFADLASTIFSGQVTTAANAGSWGGTQSYINLGGIKLCWGLSAVGSAINSGASLTRAVTLPVGFFSTVTAGFCSTYYAAGSFENWLLSEVGPTFSATTVEVIVTNVSSGTSGTTYKVFWLVIGT
jgi:hypothetical protein